MLQAEIPRLEGGSQTSWDALEVVQAGEARDDATGVLVAVEGEGSKKREARVGGAL